MEHLSAAMKPAPARPVKVLQFGEGNFLRAFVDYLIDIANEKTDFNGSIVLVKPISIGTLFPAFKDQDYRYTVMLRGVVNGETVQKTRIVSSVSDAVDAYADYQRYADYAKCETLRYIVSNTTEAGIVYDADDKLELCPPNSYPGKLTKFLYERAQAFDYAEDKGLVILPVELIDDNGLHLKECVKKQIANWNLGEKFEKWVDTACVFTSTLVDRIVTGYPRGEDKQIWEGLGYEDNILVTAEPFGLWVIESEKDISKELTIQIPDCELNVVFTEDHHPYKQRKVRILNGAHTSFVPMAYQWGCDFVKEAMDEPIIMNFMQKTLYDEVIPTLTLPREDLFAFAEAVTGRFQNPYNKHALMSICLNCVSKWRARCMPSLTTYIEKTGELPAHLTFSLAAMIGLYQNGKLTGDGKLECMRNGQPYQLQDDAAVMEFFAANAGKDAAALTDAFLQTFFPELKAVEGLEASVAASLAEINAKGMKAVVTEKFGV